MAATARPPGIGDARVPCPLCGGLIHPVAGRCKHCKQDLTSFRAGRPQAAATLPSLNGQAIAAPVPPTTLHTPAAPSAFAPPVAVNGHAGTNGHVAAAPIAVGSTREASQPILPPRETGSWKQSPKPSGSLWRSWPMIVIGVAVLAIVTAVVIMVLPQDQKKAGRKIGAPPPAPERMDVNPANPKSSQLMPPGGDPWAQPDYPAAPQPMQPKNPSPAMPDPNDPNDPNDLFGGLSGGATGSGMFMLTALDHMCTKLKSCGNSDVTMQTVCEQFSTLQKQLPAPASCSSGQKCLQAIDSISCTGDAVNVMTAVYAIQDCSEAMSDC